VQAAATAAQTAQQRGGLGFGQLSSSRRRREPIRFSVATVRPECTVALQPAAQKVLAQLKGAATRTPPGRRCPRSTASRSRRTAIRRAPGGSVWVRSSPRASTRARQQNATNGANPGGGRRGQGRRSGGAGRRSARLPAGSHRGAEPRRVAAPAVQPVAGADRGARTAARALILRVRHGVHAGRGQSQGLRRRRGGASGPRRVAVAGASAAPTAARVPGPARRRGRAGLAGGDSPASSTTLRMSVSSWFVHPIWVPAVGA